MKSYQIDPPLLCIADIARRWNMRPARVSAMVPRGELKPVIGSGRTALFSLTDLLHIESGHGGRVGFDVSIEPLTSIARTSAKHLIYRARLAGECVELASCLNGPVVDEGKRAKSLLPVICTVRGVIMGTNTFGIFPGQPAIGQGQRFGVTLAQPGAQADLLRIAKSALMHLLGSSQALDTLRNLGPRDKGRFIEMLDKLKEEILRWEQVQRAS